MRQGFSLLELSIVLVIIGLIAGGIVAGASMIRAAELRSLITQETQFKIAIYTFRDKYLGLPGDLKNATAFWGAEPVANCPGDETTPSTTTATCDGNGNGQINWNAQPSGVGNESFRFWQHLANAELISGSFTGVQAAGNCNGTGECEVDIDINAPSTPFSGAGWSIDYRDASTSLTGNHFPRPSANIMFLGTEQNYTTGAFLSPAEAWNLDKKNDDGKPGTGRVRPWSPNHAPSANCSTSPDPSVSEYNLSSEDISCSFVIIFD